MLLPAALTVLQAVQTPVPQTYHGRSGELAVTVPRIESEAVIDGMFDEEPWRRAALLTGFSQYMPVDGIPARDSTEVFVWYAPNGIYFGFRAYEPHARVNATLADRDKIDTDDYIQVLLDTYNDRRRAFVFGVNPLGVQADGIRSEGSMGSAGGRSRSGRFENVDMNPDFIFDSKGHVTDFGYQVELFIPFKSIRYQTTDSQTWAINVIRRIQHSGYEDTWVPARRANASFLAQSGTLNGLTGLRRGLVLDLNPFGLTRVDGSEGTENDWTYDATPEIGANARWGVTANLTLNAAINPDFSQVEADVGVVTVNERFAVFYPETRPFFLEGIEQFDTPNQLIYTRRIVEPLGGVKLTGKTGPLNVAFLSAIDDKPYSASGNDLPLFSLLRLRHDVGENSTIGISYTDRSSGGDYNRVAAADAHLVFADLYFFEAQFGGAFTHQSGTSTFGPIWELGVDRTGRHWGFHYAVKGVDRDFTTESGFVPRTGVVEPRIINRLTTYGKPGDFLESYTAFLMLEGVWDYEQFFDFAAPLETTVRANNRFTIRGGWNPSVTPVWLTAAFDPEFYSSYYVETMSNGVPDTVPFVTPERVDNALSMTVGVTTPQFPRFAANVNLGLGKDISYFEPARANAASLSTTANWRPTEQLRLELRYTYQRLTRERDGTRLSTAHIPRLKVEYQVSRPLFIRVVGQYTSQELDALRDPATDEPILLYDAETDSFARSTSSVVNDFRVDLLFSFRPTPGTVMFLGYGASLTEPNAFGFRELKRTADGFFAKASYLFRM